LNGCGSCEIDGVADECIRYDPHSETKAKGPWKRDYLESALEQWNDDVLDEAMHGETWLDRGEDEYDSYDR
jgi:hypothetical protein